MPATPPTPTPEPPAITLHPSSVEAIAQRVVELLRQSGLAAFRPSTVDEWLTKEQAAEFLNLSARTFDRLRLEHLDALKPALENPLRFSKNALDIFKVTKGQPLYRRRGRPPQQSLI